MSTPTAPTPAMGTGRPRPTPPARYKNFIAGQWVESAATKSVPNVSPADTRVSLGQVPYSTPAEVDAAVAAAASAFPAWRDTPAPVRGNLLVRWAGLLARHTDELAAILAWEEGKTFGEARGEVLKATNIVEFMAGEGRRMGGHTIPSEMPRTFVYTVKAPLGPVAVITPWNFPIAIPCWKIAPALVAGNTIVFKPATLTPWTAMRAVELLEEAGLPKGVLNLVFGSGAAVGDQLVHHTSIRALTFTGSNEVGTHVYTEGAKRLLKVQCELGGKNPLVVLEDADLELAADATAQGAFGSTGQRCTATSRAIVVNEVADRFVELLAARAQRVVVGDPLADGVTMGPSVDDGQFKTVLDYLDVAKKEGARLVAGGCRLAEGAHANGHFVAPTIYDGVTAGMRIAKEEIFGPVLSVIRVKDFDEAVHVANDVDFGLSSSLYTNDVNRMYRFVDLIETGIVHVNSPTVGGEAQAPFGGMKGTGVGTREQGSVAVDFFTELKTVYADYTGTKRTTNIY
jgi:acyl-CoA reductase-like NAD-dependent aldehyde dehydrogenase